MSVVVVVVVVDVVVDVVVIVALPLHAQPVPHNYFSKTPKQPLIVVHDRASAFKQFKDARKCQDAGCSKQPRIVQIVSKKVFCWFKSYIRLGRGWNGYPLNPRPEIASNVVPNLSWTLG